MTDPALGRAAFERLADAALGAVGGDVEVVVQRQAEGLTRFAASQVHQNTWRDDMSVTVRVVVDGGRIGVVGVHSDDPAEVTDAARRAAELARLAPHDREFPGLSPRMDVPSVPVDEATSAASPGDRAAAVRAALEQVPGDCSAAGAYRTCAREIGVFTSAGQRAYAPASTASMNMVVMTDTSSGWAEAGGRRMADIDPAATAQQAVAKAAAGREPRELAAGVWPVILEPPAVASVMQYLAYLGFGGRDYLEHRSCVASRLGQQMVDAQLTLADDAAGPVSAGLPFDYEGTPKTRVELLRDGVAAAVVHDRHTAALAGTTSTGHALPAPNPWGPVATSPILQPGTDGSTDDLVSRCDRGLLVTRFHYTNVVHPKETVITGMTRDGTFLIEGGRVTSAVRNLRFTQSILTALQRIDGITSQTGYATEIFDDGGRFPSLALPAFSFSGTTSFG